MTELTQEDVFNDDKDPLEAIREIRKEEGNEPDEELESSLETDTRGQAQSEDDTSNDDDLGELEPDEEPADINEGQNADNKPQTDVDEEDEQPAQKAQTVDNEEDTDDSDEEKVQEETEAKADVKTKTFKANGQEFSFTEEEMMSQFETIFGQAMNYTQKMQKIAPYRKMISALEQEGLTNDQLNIAIDALKGDKGALAKIIKTHGIDAYDLGDEEASKADDYAPTQYGKDEAALNIEEVSQRLSVDKEYPITVDIIGKQWDDNSRTAFANNPQLIVGLHNDVKTGKYDEVAPVAMKMKVLDGSVKSDIEYYMLAGEQLRQQRAQGEEQQQQQQQNAQQQTDNLNQQTQDAVSKNEEASSVARRKRSASSTRTRADRQGVIDYLDDDDEKFDSWYKDLMSKN
jgi:hypothetical protein